jgi:large subunit ribosomal protein L29
MPKKTNNLHDQDVDKLVTRLGEIDGELFALRNELAMNKKLDKPHLIKLKRKEKAQILTVMTQKLISREVS